MTPSEIKMVRVTLETIYRLQERTESALLPDMEDTPTARDENKQAQHLVSVLLDILPE